MKSIKSISALIFAITLFHCVKAQDIHLSQFEASPLFLNPALGGQFYGDWRAGTSLREQWRSIEKPYQSFVAFYDRKVNYYSKQINLGVIAVHDKSGNAALTAEKIYLSLAYPIKKGRSTVSIGIQPGIVMKFYENNLTYPSQFDNSTGYFNSNLSNAETGNYGNTNNTYFDLNAGLFWQLNLPKVKPSFGISLSHLNQAQDGFNNKDERQKIRQTMHGNAVFSVKNNQYIKPSIYFTGQNKANEFLIGGEVGRYFKGPDKVIKEVFAGMYLRNGYNRNTDAFLPVIGFQYQQWRIGISYDITISELDAASNNKGAFELSIIYRSFNSTPKHTAIPCDRF